MTTLSFGAGANQIIIRVMWHFPDIKVYCYFLGSVADTILSYFDKGVAIGFNSLIR